MEMMKIPHTDLEVPRLALGCMGLGGGWEADVQLTKDHQMHRSKPFLNSPLQKAVEFSGVAGEFRCYSLHRSQISKDL
jgi:hypothetical protein